MEDISASGSSSSRFKHLSLVGIGLLFTLGVMLKLPGLNGVSAWRWPWHDPPLVAAFAYMVWPVPLLLFAIRKIGTQGTWSKPTRLLFFLTTSAFLLQLGGIGTEGADLDKLRRIVISPEATSYFTDALRIGDLPLWLSVFDRLTFHLHSATHPPGPILYYYLFIKAFGPSAAPYIGGMTLGLLASLGVLVIYLFSGLWTSDVTSRLLISALYAVLPGLILFFPEFDQVYPILAMLIIYCWEKALGGRYRWALVSGLVLFFASFFAYNILTIGVFMVLSGVYFVTQRVSENPNPRPFPVIASAAKQSPPGHRDCFVAPLLALTNGFQTPSQGRVWRTRLSRLLVTALIALGVWSLCYVVLYVATEFDPIASFSRALASQQTLEQRPHLVALLWNLYDFALGSGIPVALLALFYMSRTAQHLMMKSKEIALSIIGFVTILIVHLTGLLNYETARVWLFLQPLIVVPAGLELSRLHRTGILAVFVVQWILLSAMKSRMMFINA